MQELDGTGASLCSSGKSGALLGATGVQESATNVEKVCGLVGATGKLSGAAGVVANVTPGGEVVRDLDVAAAGTTEHVEPNSPAAALVPQVAVGAGGTHSAPAGLGVHRTTTTEGEIHPVPMTAAAAIKEVTTTPKRASPRLAKNIDIDSVNKAKKRAAWKNLDFSTGNMSDFSFIQFPSVDISKRLSNLGINLGHNTSLINDSVNLLKEVELARSRPDPASTEVLANPDFFNVVEEDLDDVNLGYLCEELLEDFVDDNSDHLSCDFKTVFKKNKSPSINV